MSVRLTSLMAAGARVALGAALAAGPALAQHPPVVEGRVVDRVTGAPVHGARVEGETSGGGTTWTDEAGAFVLRALNPGPMSLVVAAVGYRPGRTELEAGNGRVHRVRVELAPDPLQVGGVRVAADASAGGEAVVLERAHLEARGGGDLATVLADVPGLVVTRQGGPGSPATVSIRGGAPDQVLVLLDGVPMNAPLTGGVDLSTLTLDGVERVTVLPGVQSARYGPRALSGVILVEARRPGAAATRGAASAGSFGSARVAAGAGAGRERGVGGLTGRIGGEWRTSRGDFFYDVPDARGGGTATRLNADARTLTVSGSGAWARDGARVRALADLLDLDRGMPGPVTAPSPAARQTHRRWTAGAGATVEGHVRWEASLDGTGQDVRFTDPAPPSRAPYDDRTRAQGWGVRLSVGRRLGDVDGEVGTEARTLSVRSSALASDAPTRQRSLGGWVAATWRPPAPSRWSPTVSAALRADGHTSVGGVQLSPRLGASVSSGRWTLRASVGGGFSPPSVADQFFQEGVLVQPNPDLGAERVRGEVSVGGDLRLFTIRRLSAGLSLDAYRADVDGMILWFPDFRFVWSPRNFDVHRRGAEAALDLSADLLDTRLRATAARSRVTYAGSALEGQVAYRPEWTAGATLSSSWRGWSTELGARYTGERRTVPGSSLNTLDPFWTLDLRLAFGWTLGAWRTTARATVANLLDERAAMIPDYPLPGRAWGLELSFTPRR